jgi:hypothetical protein
MKTTVSYDDGLILEFDGNGEHLLFGSDAAGWHCSCAAAIQGGRCAHLRERAGTQTEMKELRSRVSGTYQDSREVHVSSPRHGELLIIRLEERPACVYWPDGAVAWCEECETTNCYHIRETLELWARHHDTTPPGTLGDEKVVPESVFKTVSTAEEAAFGLLHALSPLASNGTPPVTF